MGDGRLSLDGAKIVLAAGAHDALSAKLAEGAGFDAVWASGFGLSAVRAVPDANILTLTETLDGVRRIVEAVSVPVIADGDNGYGNAINVMRAVAEIERAGAAGVSLEDNDFPKRCSFYDGVRRELVAVEEHARKIAAATAARRDRGFMVIARTEALVAGRGMADALGRARAYADAGADAILVHSKAHDFSELREFARSWDRPLPLVAVPTTYPTVSADELQSAGFRMAIFANQALRAAIVAVRDTLAEIRRSGRTAGVEDRIASLAEVHALVGVPELEANERRFLLAGEAPPHAVILAAGFEPQLMPLIKDRPKAMLDVKGRTILERQLAALGGCGIRDVVVVRGYKKDQICLPGVSFVDNDRFADTGEVHSLLRAEHALAGPLLVLYGDILFESAVLEKLLRAGTDVAVVVDRAFHDTYRAGVPLPPGPLDLVVTETPPHGRRFVAPEAGSAVLRIGPEVAPEEAHGEFIGMAMFSARGSRALRAVHTELAAECAEGLERASLTKLIQAMIDRGQRVTAVEIHKGWMEIDTFEDYRRAWAEVSR